MNSATKLRAVTVSNTQPRKIRKPQGQPGVVAQVKTALKPAHRTATILGMLLGGFVPVVTFAVAHHEVSASVPLYLQPSVALVLGGLLFSARTVFVWAALAFQSPAKALGFVVLAEGAMVLSGSSWVNLAALCYLVAINGIATGVILALGKGKQA